MLTLTGGGRLGGDDAGERDVLERVLGLERVHLETDTFNDKQSQTAERKTGDGRGPGDHSSEAG